MDNNFSSGADFQGESAVSSNGGDIMQKAGEMKDNVSKQAVAMKDRLSVQAGQLGNQLSQRVDYARGKASNRLRSTSQKLHNLAIYVEEHNARDISDAVLRSSRDVIRKHPGRSILVGIVAGLLLGRVLRAARR